MKAALVVIKREAEPSVNLAKVLAAIELASAHGADIALFAETTINGLIPNDNVEEMLPLGHKIPGPITRKLADACRQYAMWISIGLLERSGGQLFDAAIMIDPLGEIVMKYRRISPRWRWRKSDTSVFCEGTRVEYGDTPFGRFVTLICGDFFNLEGQLAQAKALNPDFLHVPLVRSGEEDEYVTQEQWDHELTTDYAKQARAIGVPVFLVNYIEDFYFGGAVVLGGDGTVLASLPLREEGTLYYVTGDVS